MSVSGPASLGAKLFARAFTSESLLGFTGCAMAVASGSFALYMTMHGPMQKTEPGSSYFTVFAQLSAKARAGRAATLAPVPAALANEDIDPVVTGSIPGRVAKGRAVSRAPLSPDGERTVLDNVYLREIDGNSALVEINDRLGVYKVGDDIPGVGRLVAMTRQGGRPALETSRGLIVEGR